MLEISRELRKNATQAEQHLWRYLRNRRFCNIKFKRQFAIEPYIVDFVCLQPKLIIEVDGEYHLSQQEEDRDRTSYLESLDFKVIRFWNEEVLFNIQEVLERIYKELFE